MHKRKNMKSFGRLTSKLVRGISPMVCLSAMLGISPMVCIWGVPHAPKTDAAAIRENARTPIRRTQAIWESPSPISPMVCIWENAQAPRCIWGAPHAPKTGRCRYSGSRTQSERRKLFGSPQAPYLRWCVFGRMPKPRGVYGEYPMPPRQTLPLFGRMPEPQSERRKLFGSPQAPYLRWCVFGSCPSPEVYMGSAPCPQDRRCRYSGECPNPNQKDASCLGVPKPHISDGVYLGDAQAPRCLWGVPHAPKTDAAAIRGAEPNFTFSLFTFHFSSHSP